MSAGGAVSSCLVLTLQNALVKAHSHCSPDGPTLLLCRAVAVTRDLALLRCGHADSPGCAHSPARCDALRSVGSCLPSWGSADPFLGAASPEGLREESSPVPLCCCSLRANTCGAFGGVQPLLQSGGRSAAAVPSAEMCPCLQGCAAAWSSARGALKHHQEEHSVQH